MQLLKKAAAQRERKSIRRPRVAGLLETELKALIAGSVWRPYRALAAPTTGLAALANEIPRTALKAEIDALPPDQRLVGSGNLHVYCARAGEIPWALQEIGRLRELTFRAVGEGTGKRADIDLFDAYYLHLFVWDTRAEVIAGAYRLGLLDEILSRYGKRGLYTHSLFRYRTRMLDSLNPGIELGRSFVRPEYQRSFAPLLLLWRGIGRFVGRAPRYAVLFGAVSISNSYERESRRLIVEYLRENSFDSDLARHVKPRRPFGDRMRVSNTDSGVASIDDLSRLIADIECDHKGVPVLLKHYLKFGGRLLGFSLDERFSNALDGLMMVDLRKTDARALTRYMGQTGADAFLAYHASCAPQKLLYAHLSTKK